MRSDLIISTASMMSLLIVWQLFSWVFNSALLPPPLQVLQSLMNEISSGVLPYHLGVTLARLGVSFFLAMIFGTAIGILLGRNQQIDRFFDSWLVIFLNIPALVTIILCYVWFGLVETAAVLAVVVNKLPNVVVTLREGTRALNRDLLEMAQAYRFGSMKTIRDVIWPQLFPFIMVAARTGLALIWKIVLVVELLGRSNGMGYQLHLFFQLFDVSSILAYTIAFIAIIHMIEITILKPLEVRSQRWRR